MHRVSAAVIAILLASACGAAARLPRADAERIALARVPGTVVEIERENDGARAITEVVVRGSDGHLYGIEIDEATREVLQVEDESAEGAADEDREAAEGEVDDDDDGEEGDVDDDSDEDRATDADHDGATDEHGEH